MSKEALSTEEIAQIEQLCQLVNKQQHYKLLGLGQKATNEEIQTAYIALSKKWHPDRFFRKDISNHVEQIDQIFIGLTTAWQNLIDPKKRMVYDQFLKTLAPEEPTPVVTDSYQYSHRKGKRRREREEQRKEDTDSSTETTRHKTIREERREQILQQFADNRNETKQKAMQYYNSALEDYQNGDVMKAAMSLHLACKLEPTNTEFETKYKAIRKEARLLKAQEYFNAAESAESYQDYARAIEQYKNAVSYECKDARAYARLAYLLDKLEPDSREVVRLLQIAVQKDPQNIDYHCNLAEAYTRAGLQLNAKREYQAALNIDKNCTKAIEGLKQL